MADRDVVFYCVVVGNTCFYQRDPSPLVETNVESLRRVLDHARTRGLPAVAMRVSNPYGPLDWQPSQGQMIKAAALGKMPVYVKGVSTEVRRHRRRGGGVPARRSPGYGSCTSCHLPITARRRASSDGNLARPPSRSSGQRSFTSSRLGREDRGRGRAGRAVELGEPDPGLPWHLAVAGLAAQLPDQFMYLA